MGRGVALAVAALVAAGAAAEDWPQFRGRARDGVSHETGLGTSWEDKAPREVWRQPVGDGFSGLSVVGDRLYTMFAAPAGEQQLEYAAAFVAATGEELWRTPLGERYDTEFGHGPRATPTVDGDTVYVLDARGHFAALAAADGKKRWEIDFVTSLESRTPRWGAATSALVLGDVVVVESGGAKGRYTGLDKSTGAVRWQSGEAGGPGYNSPLLITVADTPQVVYVSGDRLRAIDARGEEVWSHPWPLGETHAMPVFVAPDKLFVSGAEGIGGVLLKLVSAGGKVSVEEVWKNPTMRNHFSSSVAYGDYLYGFDNATFKCLAVATGEVVWAKRGLGKGSLIAADGRLLVLSDRGRLALVEPSPTEYVEKGSVQALEGQSWTPPTLAGGRIYLRNHTQMVSYDLAG